MPPAIIRSCSLSSTTRIVSVPRKNCSAHSGFPLPPHRGLNARKEDREGGPLPRLARSTDGSAAVFDDTVDDCQSQACSLSRFLGRVEGLKQVGRHFFCHTRTRVTDPQLYVSAW